MARGVMSDSKDEKKKISLIPINPTGSIKSDITLPDYDCSGFLKVGRPKHKRKE
jgi:hypothetical protein